MSRPARAWDDWADDEELHEGLDDSLRIAVGETAEARPQRARTRRSAPAPAGAPRTAPRRHVRWGQLAVVSLLGYLLVTGASSEFTYLRVSHQREALARQATTIAAQNRALRRQIHLLHQRRYVNELARTELGYTSPGEVELVPRSGH